MMDMFYLHCPMAYEANEGLKCDQYERGTEFNFN